MGSSSSQHANRDIVHKENKTHVEVQTKHLYVKHDGFHLFEFNSEGSSSTTITHGLTGIGLVGEVCLGIAALALLLWLLKKWSACRVRHTSYKAFYRAQVADAPYSLRVPTLGQTPNGGALPYYGPNTRALTDLNKLADDVKELKVARKAYERAARSNASAVSTQNLRTSPGNNGETVYTAEDQV